MQRILVVEDNEVNCQVMSRYLSRWGFEATIATDGEQATSKIQSGEYDLVLMDLGLPKIDGWELTRRFKSDATTCNIPIIAVTGYAVEGDRKKALAAGCDEYISKPLDFDRLREMIEALLNENSAGT